VSLFPAFLDLTGRRVLVVGGGPVAAGKVGRLAEAGACVTVVAERVHADIAWSGVAIVRRAFEDADLDGVWLVIAAATPEVNQRVADAALQRRVFVNAVDDPARASFYSGGVLRRGGITIAVSTDGHAPALAGLLREAFEAVIPEEIETWAREARVLRQWQRADGIAMERRRPLLLEALNQLYETKREVV
jgi:uroporphyrin-III C-methyltransferase / precorrin-2 dehydrogenase / sirohydrochlorin ferrochelatase